MKNALALFCCTTLLVCTLAGCGPAPSESPAATATPAPTATASPTPVPATPTPAPTPEPTPETYTPGVRTETDYTNTSLGLYFSPSETMVMATDEEMAAMLQGGSDLLYNNRPNGDQLTEQAQSVTRYEMAAMDVVYNGNVLVATETMPLENITEEQYILAIRQQLERADLPVEIQWQEEGTVQLGDTAFRGATYTITLPEAPGAQICQTVLVKRIADQMCTVAFSYSDAQLYAAMLDCFHPLYDV